MAGWVDTIVQDVSYALRSFRKNPGFVAVALLSLTLGIGATSAIFSVIYGVLISPYPYAKPDEIWALGLRSQSGQEGRGAYSLEEYREIAELPAFSDVMATSLERVLLTGDFAPESFTGVLLSGNAFSFLGVPPVIGRSIQSSDIAPSGEGAPVVVLSHRLWQRLFDGRPDAVGRTLRLNDRPHTVVGVMPPRFGWYGHDSMWLPLGMEADASRFYIPIARLSPGVSAGEARDQLHALHLRLAEAYPDRFPADGFTTNVTNYLDVTVASGEMRTTLHLLFAAVTLLLLITCVNVANLQLARATARSREMALRLSIGAQRGRLLRQLLTESVLLSLVGGALGVLVAWSTTTAIVALMPEFYLPNEARVTLNTPVLLFSLAVAVMTGVVFGLAPAWRASRPDLTEALKTAARGSGAGARGGRLRAALVVVEVALSVVLLMGAGLTIRTFVALQQVDVGFRPEGIVRVGVPLLPARYPTIEQRNLFARDLLDRVKALPGVQAAALGVGGMPFGGPSSTYSIEGQPEDAGQRLTVNLISEDYLQVLGVPLRRGRVLAAQEIDRGARVALVNEAAGRLWRAGDDPVGARIRLGVLDQAPGPDVLIAGEASPEVTVVGIVADTRNAGLRDEARPVVYVPYTLVAPLERVLTIRAHGDPTLLLSPLREQLRAIDREQPLGRPMTFEEVLGLQTAQPRFTMALFGVFAALGLLIAAAGIYSVLSYLVTRRTHEIGVRMALGARRADVLRLMLVSGGRLVALGLAIGLAASLVVTDFMRALLFGVSPLDPVSFVAVAGVLSIVGLAACYVPARRAQSVDPLIALRDE